MSTPVAGSSTTPLTSNREECGHCGSIVAERDKALLCEICGLWYHIKCQKVSEETYKLLKRESNTNLHWYCSGCDKGIAKVLETIVGMQKQIGKLAEEIADLNVEVANTNSKVETIMKDVQARVEEMIAVKLEEEVRKKEIKMENISSQIKSVTKTLDEVRSSSIQERDRESRAANIILYNVPESRNTKREDRWKTDREFCLALFNKALKVDIREDDLKRFVRLGKVLEDDTKSRPIMIQFRDRILKNMVMESLSRLKDADDIFKSVIFAHDLTKEDRLECRILVEEAKQKEKNQEHPGEFIFRVRGSPGNFKIHRIHRRA
jgi:PHD-finger